MIRLEKKIQELETDDCKLGKEVTAPQGCFPSLQRTSEPHDSVLGSDPQPPAAHLFRYESNHWTVNYEEKTVRLNDTQGFHHLAALLRAPGRQFHVAELLGITDGQLDRSSSRDDSSSERTRKAVANRLRTAMAKIKKAHPALWRHLVATVKTGKFCSHNPERQIEWRA
jgi:hypothetical protein